MPQTAGQMVALALKVISRLAQFQPVDTAPASALGIGFVHRFQPERPERIKAGKAIAFEHCPIILGNEIVHSRP